MIKKIISKFKTAFGFSLLRFALLINNADLAAAAMSFVAWRIGQGEFRVLCLGRTIFVDDVKAMAKYSGKIQYLVIHLQYFESILSYFVPPLQRKLITEANYLTTSEGKEGRGRYYDFLTRLLPKLQARLGIQAIMSGHLSYVVQQEIITAAEKSHIPFIVLHKEALDVYGGILDTYRNYKFQGTKILFYNQKIRDELVKRISGLGIEKTAVVGVPRLDFYFLNKRAPKSKQIAFFCFFPQDKFLVTIKDEKKITEIKKFYESFHGYVMDFAAKHKEFSIIFKTKAAQHYFDYVYNIYREKYPSSLSNLLITKFASTADLIVDSDAVIGFDSTVLIEAIAAGRPIIRPDFREQAIDQSWDFMNGFEELINYVKTEEDLEQVLLANKPIANPAARERFLITLIGDSSGTASSRAEQEIIGIIHDKKYV